jgi:hypothetical protein
VKTSIIDGKPVMENRRLLTMDLPAVMERVRAIAAHIQSEHS